MANDVKWIKMMVGMFDGMSFKKIKRAKIGGESFRDKLTAIWFELMDFAGKCNHNGSFVGTNEIPFTNLSDIAVMIDRDEEELQLCMNFYINEGMVTIINDVYSLTNWSEYQNKEGLDKIREQNRKRVAKHRENKKLLTGNVTCNVTVTQCNAIEEDKEEEKDIEIDNKKERVDCQQIVDLYHSICQSFSKIRSLSEARKKAIKARLNTYSLEEFKTVFQNAENSSFLKGQNERNWVATFDWLIKATSMEKVLEGNYADKTKRKEPTPKWMQPSGELGSAELEAIQKMLREPDEPDPEVLERAEQLKRTLQEKYGKGQV